MQQRRVALHQLQLPPLLHRQRLRAQQIVHRAEDQRDRRAQLMRHVGKEIRLHLIELLHPVMRLAQLRHCLFQINLSLDREPRLAQQIQNLRHQRRQHERPQRRGRGRHQLQLS